MARLPQCADVNKPTDIEFSDTEVEHAYKFSLRRNLGFAFPKGRGDKRKFDIKIKGKNTYLWAEEGEERKSGVGGAYGLYHLKKKSYNPSGLHAGKLKVNILMGWNASNKQCDDLRSVTQSNMDDNPHGFCTYYNGATADTPSSLGTATTAVC